MDKDFVHEKVRIWQEKHNFKERKERVMGTLATLYKCWLLLLIPTFIGLAVCSFWYFCCWNRGVHFGPELEGIMLAGWILIFGVLYGLFATTAFQTVWTEYKEMRTAVKRYDIDRFMELRDENLSPLLHTIMVTLSCYLLGGFIALEYPGVYSGAVVIFAIAFLLTLMLCVIIEVDDPTAGLWFIQKIPKEWLNIDPRGYRKKRNRLLRDKFLNREHWFFAEETKPLDPPPIPEPLDPPPAA